MRLPWHGAALVVVSVGDLMLDHGWRRILAGAGLALGGASIIADQRIVRQLVPAATAVAVPDGWVSVVVSAAEVELLKDPIVLRWLVEPGEHVDRGQDLVEISADKADVVIPAPASGRLAAVYAIASQRITGDVALAAIDPTR